MSIHIGENISLLEKDIIAILDINSALESEDTRVFIDQLIKNDCFVGDLEKNVKSYIITADNDIMNRNNIKKYRLYTSNISSVSLLKRINTRELDWRKVND